MAVTGIVTMLQFLVIAQGEIVPVLGGFLIPTIGTTTLGWLLARKHWAAVLLALVAIPLAHVLAVTVFAAIDGHGSNDLPAVALVVDAVTLVLAFPALVACAVQGPRVDHDAGDALLAFGGGWFAVEQGLCFGLAEGRDPAWMFAVGVAIGALALAIGIARAVYRRAWTGRVARGLVGGWRVRTDAAMDEAQGLAPLFGGHTALAILERFEVQSSPYRSAPIAQPVALVPVR